MYNDMASNIGTNSGSNVQAELDARPTSVMLASTDTGKGAGMVGTESGVTVQEALNGKSALRYPSPDIVGSAPAYIPTLGEVVNETISLERLAGRPSNSDYTSWFGTQAANYPFKRILLPKGVIHLAGPVISGANNIIFEGQGATQSTLKCPSANSDILKLHNCEHISFRHMGFQHYLDATSGVGLLVEGNSDQIVIERCYAANNPDGHIHFIGSGGGQSGNKILGLEAIDSRGPAVKLFNSHDWSIMLAEVGRVGGLFGYAAAGFWIENSHQGAFLGGCKAWDNEVALYAKNSQACQWGSNADRFEESRKENIILDGCVYGSVAARTHTASKSSELAGPHSGIKLINGTSKIQVSVPQVYSWAYNQYLMKHGLEIDASCTENLVCDMIVDSAHCVNEPFGGAGATNGLNYFSNTLPRSPRDYDIREAWGANVPEGFSYLTPTGAVDSVTKGGWVTGQKRILRNVAVAVLASPLSGSYTYQIFKGASPVGSPFKINTASFSASSGELNIALGQFDVVTVQVSVPNGSGITTHRAVATFI